MTAILTASPKYIIHCKYLLRVTIRKLNLKQLWRQDNGNWKWIKEKPTPIVSLNRSLWRLSVPNTVRLTIIV